MNQKRRHYNRLFLKSCTWVPGDLGASAFAKEDTAGGQYCWPEADEEQHQEGKGNKSKD